jgi:2-dehydropantoate 2-reductase
VTPITGSGAVAGALAEHGFRVRELDGSTWSTPARHPPLVTLAEATPGLMAPIDACIIATQSTRLEEALATTLPHLAPDALVVCCQNGLPEERAARVVESAGVTRRVIGCVVGWGASMVEPGLYVRTSKGRLQLGRPAGDDPRFEAVRALLEAASPVEWAENFVGVRWSKLAVNCATSTLGAIGGKPLGALLRHRFVRRLALRPTAGARGLRRGAGRGAAPRRATYAHRWPGP